MKDEELERLFRTYHGPLVRYLTRRLGDRDWAEEVEARPIDCGHYIPEEAPAETAEALIAFFKG